MIIVLTNRILPVEAQIAAAKIKVTEMGVTLNDKKNASAHIRAGILSADYQTVSFTAKGNESSVFDYVEQADKYKPWVFFLHGFHQDPEENIAKAKSLYVNYGVNVIAFAWPSRPEQHEMTMHEMKQIVKEDVLSASVGVSTLSRIGTSWVYKALKDRWANYEPAIANAEASNKDLLAAIQLIRDCLQSDRPAVFLVHSMGNYLLQNALANIDSLDIKFSNIILHQADVDAEQHDWVRKLNKSLTDTGKLYITSNSTDYVLAASYIRRKLIQDKTAERLGQTRKNYLTGDIHYLDFTDAEFIDNKHEIFVDKRSKTNEDVFDCLGRLFRGEIDLLPRARNESNAGFSKMPTEIHLYQLEEILDPVEDVSVAELVPSLKWFKDPLAAQPDYQDDPDFDD